jgi:hypothetical protein
MCLITVRWAFEQTDLPHAEHFVLLALANCLNSKTLLCCPSLHTLGKVTGLSRRKIAYCLRRLESLGYIETSTRHEKNRQRSSLYTLHAVQGGGACGAALGMHAVQTEPVTEPVREPEVPAQGANKWRIDLDQEKPDPHDRRYPDTQDVRRETIVNEPPKARLFREGKTILVSLGLSESRSGAVIGQWLKRTPDADGILAALVYARDQGVIEPIGYVTRLLNSGGKTNGYRQEEPAAERAYKLAEQARELERQAGFGRQDDVVRRH